MDIPTQIALLQGTLRVIDIAAVRGAIHGEELSDVGSIRNGILQLILALQTNEIKVV